MKIISILLGSLFVFLYQAFALLHFTGILSVLDYIGVCVMIGILYLILIPTMTFLYAKFALKDITSDFRKLIFIVCNSLAITLAYSIPLCLWDPSAKLAMVLVGILPKFGWVFLGGAIGAMAKGKKRGNE